METTKISGVMGEGKMNRQSNRGFLGLFKTPQMVLYDTITVVTCIHLSKPTSCSTPRVNPNVN